MRTGPAAGGSTGQRTKTELSGSCNPAPCNKEITMGKPGDPTARVMMTPVPAHLTTDDDQLTDAAGIGVGRYGAKAVLAVPGAGVLLSASVIARLPLAMESTCTSHRVRHPGLVRNSAATETRLLCAPVTVTTGAWPGFVREI